MTTILEAASTARKKLCTLVRRARRYESDARELRGIEQHCRARLDELELAIRWDQVADMVGLCQVIAAQRGRAIHLEVAHLPPDLSGLWLPGAKDDYIFYSWDTVPAQRGQVILHELCHLLCGHRALVADAEAVLRPQFPLLDTDAIRRKLGRSRYDTRSEQEAEMLATLIVQRWEAARPRPACPDVHAMADSDPEMRRLRQRLEDFTSKLRDT